MILTVDEKKEICKEIYNIPKEKAIADFQKLKSLSRKDFTNGKIKFGNKVGSYIVDYFTAYERMHTISKKGLSFFGSYDKKEELMKRPSYKSLEKYYEECEYGTSYTKIWWRYFNLYMGSINQFRPIIAMNIYHKYNPQSVLDMTMGWGGRLIGACALNIPKYTGIDLNSHLEESYKNMVETIKTMTDTDISLLFTDALTVDYSAIDYDLVLTSPPYYNIELYNGTVEKTKDVWDTEFYEPLFKKTWEHLKQGGHYCLNVSPDIYNRVCIKVLGEANELIPLKKSLRHSKNEYSEYIYVWNKI
jgi:hypothetical protein